MADIEGLGGVGESYNSYRSRETYRSYKTFRSYIVVE